MSYPNKPAPTSYPINDLAKNRWSPRLFSDKPIEPEKIMTLFEAARWAPSSYNDQPWMYYYATKENQIGFKKLFDLMGEFNQAWAKSAAMLIIIFARKNFAYNNTPNHNYAYDTGAASAMITLEGEHQGLKTHQMIGFDLTKANATAGLPEAEYEVMAMMAVGYPATEEKLKTHDEEFVKRELAERTRKDLKEMIFELK